MSIYSRAQRSDSLRYWWWRHPEIPVVAVAGLAALGLVIQHLGWNHDFHRLFAGTGVSWDFHALRWGLMVIAMMLPGTLPMVRRLAFDSLWGRRHTNVGLFALTFVAGWTLAGILAASLVAAFEWSSGLVFDPGQSVVAAALVAAAAWQYAAPRQRALRQCHLRTPVAPRGWKANRDVVRYGVFHVRSCIGACGAVMAVMFLAGHDLHLMLLLTIVTNLERFQDPPRAHVGAAILIGLALITVAAA